MPDTPVEGVAPFDGVPVLICTDHSIEPVHRVFWDDGWKVNDHKHGPFALRGYMKVSHWMPLPPPPKFSKLP